MDDTAPPSAMPPSDAGSNPGSDPGSAESRIAATRAQASREVGTHESLEAGEEFATASEHAATVVGGVIAVGEGSIVAGVAAAAAGGSVLGAAAVGGAVALAAFAAGWGAAKLGSALSEAIGAPAAVARGLEMMGMHRIGSGGPHPAHKGHQVAHSNALWGFLAAIAIGVAVAVVVVATAGTGAVVLIAAAAADGFAGGFLGSAIAGGLAQTGTRTGAISDTASLRGQVAKTDILPRQQLTLADFTVVTGATANVSERVLFILQFCVHLLRRRAERPVQGITDHGRLPGND